MIKKIICLGIIFVSCLVIFYGCGGNNYNAVIYDTAKEWMNEAFLQANSTQGTKYDGVYLDNDTRPKTNTKIIENIEEFNAAFIEFPVDINFEKEMLIMYFHTGDSLINTSTGDRILTYKIKKINANNGELNIVFEKKKTVKGPTGSPPTQECLVVKMDKIEINTINVEIVNK